VPATTDRYDGLRNLLHFAGIDSVSYYLGLIIADFTLFIIPSALLVLAGMFLSIQQFKTYAILIFFILAVFGLPLITL
jgi:hypothetical protein